MLRHDWKKPYALGGNRTPTTCVTWPSTMPVCQFQHQRVGFCIIIIYALLSRKMAEI